jgi:hypothetical protein
MKKLITLMMCISVYMSSNAQVLSDVSDLEVDPSGKMLRIGSITVNVSALRQGKYQYSTVGTQGGVWTDLALGQVTPPGQVTGNQSTLQNWITPTGPIGTWQFRVYYAAVPGSGLSTCLSDVEILTITGTVLATPKLLSFTGTTVASGVKFNWTLERDDEVGHYEIQKVDENNVFKTIALWLNPKNLTSNVNYEYVDQLYSSLGGAYRLKIIAKNGEVGYSNVVVVKKTPPNTLEVIAYPNPVIDRLDIRINGGPITNKDVITIKSILGQSVLGSCNSSHINVSTLPQGVYILSIIRNGETQTTRFIKQ